MKRTILIACMLAGITSVAIAQDASPLEGSALQSLSYAGFIRAINDGVVKEVQLDYGGLIMGKIIIGEKAHYFTTRRPKNAGEDVLLLELMEEKGVDVTHVKPSSMQNMIALSMLAFMVMMIPGVFILLIMIWTKVKRIEQYQFDNAR